MADFSTDVSRWRAVQARDPRANSAFVYCVKTTNVYCRPTCGARPPRRANVTFCNNSLEAEQAGLRACKRCKPDLKHYNPRADVIVRACSLLNEHASSGNTTSLKNLAIDAGLSEWHFHRVFKSNTGLTPKEYERRLLEVYRAQIGPSPPPSKLASSHDLESIPGERSMPEMQPTRGRLSSVGDRIQASFEPGDETSPRKIDEIITLPSAAKSAIEFTVQPWSSSYVLIAVNIRGICAIDISDSYVELIAALQTRFPSSEAHLSDWSRASDTPTATTHNHANFSSVMEALENPTGKTLVMAPNTFDSGNLRGLIG